VRLNQAGSGGDSLVVLTEQRTCGFYLSWFFKLYESTDSGWWPRRTPDDRPVTKQDAYFWRCLEVIAQTLIELRIEEMQRNK
jgi:hypothetical protein